MTSSIQSKNKTHASGENCKLAFIGLGVMGYPMAGHLATAGHEVTVYNRTQARAEAFCQEFHDLKVHQAQTPADAAKHADVVFSCVGNDNDLRTVLLGRTGALAGMKTDAVLVDHTTASATVARELDAETRAQGLHFIDAPVSGGQAGAQKGVLTVMCGGHPAVFKRVENIITAYAQAVTLLGPSGAGQMCKMMNQICVAGLLQGLAEAIAFGQQAGLDVDKVLQVIDKGAAQSWQMDHRGRSMNAGQFDFGFAIDWMRKDLSLVLDEARRNGARLPLTALVDQFYADVQQMGGGRWDTSALIKRLQAD